MFVKGSLSFDLNGVKCTRKVEKNLRKVLSCRQNPQTGCVKKCKKQVWSPILLFKLRDYGFMISSNAYHI